MIQEPSFEWSSGVRRPAPYVRHMSAATDTVTALTFVYRFPSEEDAWLAPQTLGEVLDAFDGRDLIDTVEDDLLGRDMVVRVTCPASALTDLYALEPGLSGLLEGWASSSGGHLVL